MRLLGEAAYALVGAGLGLTPMDLVNGYHNVEQRVMKVGQELRTQSPLQSAWDVFDGYSRAVTQYDVVWNMEWEQVKPANETVKASKDLSNFIGGFFAPAPGASSNADDVAPLADDLAEAAAKGGAQWKLGEFKSAQKWQNQLEQRGWTPDQITEALQRGERFPAENLVNKGNAATRHVHPETGQSVVIDDVTKEVIHVGGPGFKY